ncbi:MAG: hypothetical protein U9N59_04410 [Campylobacterota bacterium]|nr:hypothetical protein [Campylobacterota bacterium]
MYKKLKLKYDNLFNSKHIEQKEYTDLLNKFQDKLLKLEDKKDDESLEEKKILKKLIKKIKDKNELL